MGGVLTCLVGPEKRRYHIHKPLAVSKSPWFATRCSTVWQQQATSEDIDCTDLDEDCFKALVHWLYKGKLRPGSTDFTKDFLHLFHSYEVANVLMMNELKSLVVDALIFRYLERGIYFSYAHINKIAALGLLRTELGTMVITSCARTLKRGTGMSKSPDDISMLVGNR